jgi:hypothetical protein
MGVSPATIRNYLLYFRKFATFYTRSPEERVVSWKRGNSNLPN